MPQRSTNITFIEANFGNTSGVLNGIERMTVEFVNGKPINLSDNTRRIWVDQVTGTLNFTTNGVDVHNAVTNATNIYDNFNRADNASLGTSTSGQTWVVASFGIIGNAAAKTSSTSAIAFINGAQANGFTQFTEKALGEAGQFYGILFRRTDNSNYWRLVVQSNAIILQKLVANVATTLINVSNTRAAGNIYTAVYVNNIITVYANGVSKGSVTDSFNSAATSVGMVMGNAPSARLDNFISGGI